MFKTAPNEQFFYFINMSLTHAKLIIH